MYPSILFYVPAITCAARPASSAVNDARVHDEVLLFCKVFWLDGALQLIDLSTLPTISDIYSF